MAGVNGIISPDVAPRRQKCDFQYAAFGRNLKEVFEVAIVAELRVFGKFPDNLVFITAYHCPDRAVVGGEPVCFGIDQGKLDDTPTLFSSFMISDPT